MGWNQLQQLISSLSSPPLKNIAVEAGTGSLPKEMEQVMILWGKLSKKGVSQDI